MEQNPWKGKHILLTGATGSLGKETAQELLKLGTSLLLPVRDPQKASLLEADLRQTCPEANLTFLPLDLSDEGSVLALAEELRKGDRPLDAIIHNAGVFTKTDQLSPQGHEWHRQVNMLSPLLLTQQLLPLLTKAEDPVVATVTSLSAFWFRKKPASSSPTQLYAASKRALLTAMEALSAQHPNIRFVYAHPGVCATGLFTGGTHRTAYNAAFLKAVFPIMKKLFPSPQKACHTTLHALQNAQTGQLSQPRGLMHIWGKPQLTQLNRLL